MDSDLETPQQALALAARGEIRTGVLEVAKHGPEEFLGKLGDKRYQLEYIAQSGSPESAAPPLLSPQLTWEQEQELPGSLLRLVIATDGNPLSSDDRITLPWRVNGVMVQPFWRSGETGRHLFPLTKEGVVIRIGDLRAGTGSVGEAAKHYTRLPVHRSNVDDVLVDRVRLCSVEVELTQS